MPRTRIRRSAYLTVRVLKRTALGGLRAAGVYRTLDNSSWRNARLVILCYHGIALEDEHLWRPALFMTRSDFRSRLETLARGKYNVLPLGEAVLRLYAGELPERSVAITFDDGNYNFFRQAFPLLREHGFPATVYLYSYYCLHQYPIFRLACSYLLWRQRGKVFSGRELRELSGSTEALDLRTPAGRVCAEQRLMQAAKLRFFSAAGRDRFAASLAELLGEDYGAIRRKRLLHLMNPQEVREVASAGMDIQLHTHRHWSLPEEADYRSQIQQNREVIEHLVERRPVHFCYPSGNHKPKFEPWLRAEQVVSATTGRTGLAHPDSDPLRLPRIVDHGGLSLLEFTGWLTGAAALLPQRHRASKDA